MNFGTAGIRALMGDGPDNLNLDTISLITLGFVRYLKSKNKNSCAIGYDTRRNSREFAFKAADVLSGHDIEVYIFDDARPTPELSFAIRHIKADSGIMITASHNTRDYNGFKVYDNRGCQLLPEETILIKQYIDDAKNHHIPDANYKNILYINTKMDDYYINTVISAGKDNHLQILYTPLHGTGLSIIPKALKYAGFENIHLVESQCTLDGSFSTIKSPNPEHPGAFDEALKNNKYFDIIVATDPDADRVALMQGSKLFSGDELGILLFNYLLTIGNRGKLIRTLVTNDLVDEIARDYNIEVIITPVGFKYIGDEMDNNVMFAFEDSCGYLHHNFVADKDAISTTVLVCEMVQYYKDIGLLLEDVLLKIYETYGEVILEKYIMTAEEVGVYISSLKLSKHITMFDSKIYYTQNKERIIVRKSGTEEGVKIYKQTFLKK